jgi:hypothetical protein
VADDHELTRAGRRRNEPAAILAASEKALAIRTMQDAVAGLQRRKTFARPAR